MNGGLLVPETPEKTQVFRCASARDQKFLVLIHTAQEPSIEEWHAYLLAVGRALADSRQRVHSFVVTDGGGPNAAQRKELADVIDAAPVDLLTHVFTTDRFVRGIVTAFRWIARARAIAHAPSEFSTVCFECGLPVREVLAVLNEAQEQLPPVKTLQLIRHVH